jgi:hypothetical protein
LRFATLGKFVWEAVVAIALFLPVAIGKVFDISRLGDIEAI